MIIRKFIESDFDSVQKLLLEVDSMPMPMFSSLDGYGLVAIDESGIVGFIWALINEKSTFAMINYFVIHESYRDKNRAALLMTQMLLDLLKMGKERIIGIVKNGVSQSGSLARMYASVGMDVSPAYVVCGSVRPLVETMIKRFSLQESHV